jgi:hypothetical protein
VLPYHVYIGEPPTLLDDLLEDSESLFQKCCAIVQRVFHEQWLTTLGEKIGEEQAAHPDEPPAVVEGRALDNLRVCRLALLEKQREMIRMHEESRAARDEAIRAYVGSLCADRPISGAA